MKSQRQKIKAVRGKIKKVKTEAKRLLMGISASEKDRIPNLLKKFPFEVRTLDGTSIIFPPYDSD